MKQAINVFRITRKLKLGEYAYLPGLELNSVGPVALQDHSRIPWGTWIYAFNLPFKAHSTVLSSPGFVPSSVSHMWQLSVLCDWLGILLTGRWANKSASTPLLYGDGVSLVRVCGPSFIFYTGLFVKDYALSSLPSLCMSYRTRGRFSIRHSMNYETQVVRRW